MEVEMLQFRGKTARMKGMAYVDGQVVTEAAVSYTHLTLPTSDLV